MCSSSPKQGNGELGEKISKNQVYMIYFCRGVLDLCLLKGRIGKKLKSLLPRVEGVVCSPTVVILFNVNVL